MPKTLDDELRAALQLEVWTKDMHRDRRDNLQQRFVLLMLRFVSGFADIFAFLYKLQIRGVAFDWTRDSSEHHDMIVSKTASGTKDDRQASSSVGGQRENAEHTLRLTEQQQNNSETSDVIRMRLRQTRPPSFEEK